MLAETLFGGGAGAGVVKEDAGGNVEAVGGEEALSAETALDRGTEVEDIAFADTPTVADPLALDGGDNHLLLEEGRTAQTVLGTVVAQTHLNARDIGVVLSLGQRAFEGITREGLAFGLGIEGVDIGSAQFDEVADLHSATPADEVGVVGAETASAGGLRRFDLARSAGAGSQEGRLVFVGG